MNKGIIAVEMAALVMAFAGHSSLSNAAPLQLSLAAQATGSAIAGGGGLDTALIEKLSGVKGKLDAESGVFKVSVPRSDLSLTIDGVKMTPALGLTSWAAFQNAGAHTLIMGDMVVLENQANAVMGVALDNGLEVTALHNHFFGDNPKVMFMHIGGAGSQEELAAAIGKVFAQIREPGTAPTAPANPIDPSKTTFETAQLDRLLGVKGELNNGVYKIVVGRQVRMHGATVGSTMGVNTWAAFAGSNERAVVDGDFAVLESELQPVLKTLRGANINIVAIHQHMTNEQPRMMFLHYWGIGRAADLARGVKAALDQTGH